VALKIWGRNGRVIYDSTDPSVVGTVYAMEPPLASAFSGEVRSRVVEKAELEHMLKTAAGRA